MLAVQWTGDQAAAFTIPADWHDAYFSNLIWNVLYGDNIGE